MANAFSRTLMDLERGPRILINRNFTDTRESLASNLEHGALTSLARTIPATATVTLTHPVLER
jgi:hypothetical protein